MTATILKFKRVMKEVKAADLLSFNDLYLLGCLMIYLLCVYSFVWLMT